MTVLRTGGKGTMNLSLVEIYSYEKYFQNSTSLFCRRVVLGEGTCGTKKLFKTMLNELEFLITGYFLPNIFIFVRYVCFLTLCFCVYVFSIYFFFCNRSSME